MKMCPPISPLPFQPPFPRAPVSLAAHVSDTSDPHRTLDLVPTLSKGSGEPSAPGVHVGDVYVDSPSGGLWSWDGASWSRVLAGRPVKTSDLVNDGDGQSPFARRSDLAELVGDAPAAFDTLKEVAEWIEDDRSGAAAMAARIASLESGKADSGSLAAVATSGSYSDLADRPAIPAPVTVDSALSATSENPVQNKAVKAAVDAKCSLADVTALEPGTWTLSPAISDVITSEEECIDTDKTYHMINGPYYNDVHSHWDLTIRDYYYVAGIDDGWQSGDTNYIATGGMDATSLSFVQDGGGLDVEYTATLVPGKNAHGLARLADLPTKTSDLTNDSGFLTSHQSLDGLMPKYALGANPTVTEGTVSWAYSSNAVDGYVIVDDFADGPEYVPDMSDFGGSATAGWHIWVVNPEDGADTLPMLASGDESATSLTFSNGNISGTIAATKTTTPATLTISPYTVSTYTAGTAAAAIEVAVGAGTTGKARDCILVIDCTATGAVAPTVTWGTHFHPRTDTATDMAIVEAGKRAVFYISEYATGEFAVGGWTETEGGNT